MSGFQNRPPHELSLAGSHSILHRRLEHFAYLKELHSAPLQTLGLFHGNVSCADLVLLNIRAPGILRGIIGYVSVSVRGSHHPCGSHSITELAPLVDLRTSPQSCGFSVAPRLQVSTCTSPRLRSSHHCPRPTTRSAPARLGEPSRCRLLVRPVRSWMQTSSRKTAGCRSPCSRQQFQCVSTSGPGT